MVKPPSRPRSDVVHSMDIAAAVGAERLREIMTDLLDRSTAVVKRYGGTLSQFTGDGSWRCSARQPRWRITLSAPDAVPLIRRTVTDACILCEVASIRCLYRDCEQPGHAALDGVRPRSGCRAIDLRVIRCAMRHFLH